MELNWKGHQLKKQVILTRIFDYLLQMVSYAIISIIFLGSLFLIYSKLDGLVGVACIIAVYVQGVWTQVKRKYFEKE